MFLTGQIYDYNLIRVYCGTAGHCLAASWLAGSKGAGGSIPESKMTCYKYISIQRPTSL